MDHRRPSAQRKGSSRLANRLDDTLHYTAGNREGVPVKLAIGARSRWLTEVHGDGGADGLQHLRAGVRR